MDFSMKNSSYGNTIDEVVIIYLSDYNYKNNNNNNLPGNQGKLQIR